MALRSGRAGLGGLYQQIPDIMAYRNADPAQRQQMLAGWGLGGGGGQAPQAPPANQSLVPGTSAPPAFGGDAGSFLQSLFQARPAFVAQQGELLSKMGPALRDATRAASPELAQLGDYLNQSFQNPFGSSLSTYQDSIRTAQAARGFGSAGGTAPAGEEARYLTNLAERRRAELAPQLQSYGNNMLQIAGLQAPPDAGLAAIGGLALQNRNLIESVYAGNRQSEISERLFSAFGGGSPFGGAGGGGSVEVGNSYQNLYNVAQSNPANYRAPLSRVGMSTQRTFNPYTGQYINVDVPY